MKKAPNSSMAGHDFAKLKRGLLAKLGRGNEALEAAWAEYREQPSKYSYDDLMKYVPKAERAAWHEEAIEAAKGSGWGARQPGTDRKPPREGDPPEPGGTHRKEHR